MKTKESYTSAQVVDYGIYTHCISIISQIPLATMETQKKSQEPGQEYGQVDRQPQVRRVEGAGVGGGDLLGVSLQMEHGGRFSSSCKRNLFHP